MNGCKEHPNGQRGCMGCAEVGQLERLIEHLPVCSDGLLESLVEECRKLVDASGLEGGRGNGWETYDGLMTELRKRLKAAESYLANSKAPFAQVVCSTCLGRGYLFGPSRAHPITEAQEEPEMVECHKCNGTGKQNDQTQSRTK
jgi:hypothetical protein